MPLTFTVVKAKDLKQEFAPPPASDATGVMAQAGDGEQRRPGREDLDGPAIQNTKENTDANQP
jgi:hypothetical protein